MTARVLAALVFGLLALAPRGAEAQLGAMVSPGRLSRAHASLEGVANCQSCHEAGRGVTPAKCLSCHKPIAERIRLKKGVHREAANDCVSCHVEHAGVDAELRPFDTHAFDHAKETGFTLDGKHAPVACASCHKTRSFLTAKPDCASCHRDVHRGQLGPDCTRCHATTITFKETRTRFDHSRTGFPLTGAHRRADCATCHPNGRYAIGAASARRASGRGPVCASCHKSPHKAPLGPACAACHGSETWKTDTIEHARTGFALKGLHAKVACASCHRQPAVTAALPSQKCADCHSDPHRGKFKQDCASCHNERGFGGAPFDHAARTRFALLGAHAKLRCASCHKGDAAGTPAARRTGAPAARRARAAARASAAAVDFGGLQPGCASCHQDVHRGDAGPACETCHSSVTFHEVSYVHKSHPEFFTEGHANLPCAKCHGGRLPRPQASGVNRLLPLLDRMPRLMLTSSRGLQLAVPRTPQAPRGGSREPGVSTWRFKGVATDCASCHKDPHLGQLGPGCERCHTVAGRKFAAVKFTHASSGFALAGKHATVECAKCHRTESAAFPAGEGTAVRYTGMGADCASCHKDTHLGQLGRKCELCHDADGFQVENFRHVLRPEMGRGRHAGLECQACHKREEGIFPEGRGTAIRYLGFGEGCASCHADVHQGSLGTTCETCHGIEAFKTISRAFHKNGTFPLEGRHLDVACASCHVDGQIKGTPTRCYDCHWARRQDDRYQLRLGTDCESCHRPASWTATRWSHVAATGIALNPTHRILGCDSCHKRLEFRPSIGVDCASCHLQQFQQTTRPNHVAAGFPTACEACHRPADPDWNRARFDHSSFQLVGQHKVAECASCHRGSVYQGTPRDCLSCHQADYQSAKQPDHVSAGFSTACEGCHRASDPDWHRATFNHDRFFRLDGAHRAIDCVACHVNGRFAGTPRDCVACHRQDYDRTRSPNHAAAGFSTNCALCHRSSDPTWGTGGFNHDSIFRLQGVHRTIECASCHQNGRFAGTPRECVACHRPDYDRTRNPSHAAAGFSTSCETCHRASDPNWTSGAFNHDTVFRLEGAHRAAQCASCHVNGRYAGTPRDCVSCHRADYDRTADPNHLAAGFPTTCDSCHRASDSSWNQGRFTHPFPISGPHNVPCSGCHITPNNYRSFSCTVCHERAKTDESHQGEAGYRYDSTACYACHPNGKH